MLRWVTWIWHRRLREVGLRRRNTGRRLLASPARGASSRTSGCQGTPGLLLGATRNCSQSWPWPAWAILASNLNVGFGPKCVIIMARWAYWDQSSFVAVNATVVRECVLNNALKNLNWFRVIAKFFNWQDFQVPTSDWPLTKIVKQRGSFLNIWNYFRKSGRKLSRYENFIIQI